MKTSHRLTLLALFCGTLPLSAEEVYKLDDFTVSAGPLARAIDDFASPFSWMDEAAIRQSHAGTLGELLNGQPGVTASSFGGGASRPIIRGFDGPRVGILESGLGAADVSETSPDHAVTVEPLLTERVEVLRGPATLLYGSSAIGGVVNVVGRELPRKQPTRTLSGAFEARHDTVSDGETLLGYTTFSEGPLVVTVQGLKRRADDYEIPGDAEAHEEEHADHDHEEHGGGDTLTSSFVETDFYSVGASWFFNERNYFGLAVSGYDSFYGVPGHEHAHEAHGDADDDDHADDEGHGEEGGIAIDLERTRFDAELAVFDPMQWIEAIRVRLGYTDYEHSELESEDGEIEAAATFERESWELRAEAAHYGWAVFTEGVFGIQIIDTDFQVMGEETQGENPGEFAFGPPSTTRSQAFFFSEHIHNDDGDLHFEMGGRIERQTVEADGLDDYSDMAFSLGLSAIWEIDEVHSLALSLQRTERHPNATELYAAGPHLATSQFQVGDEDLGKETAYGMDLTYRYRSDDWEATASFFYTYFEDYIFDELQPGEEIDELQVYNYIAADTLFYGFEAELNHVAYRSGGTTIRLGVLADYVVAENRDDDEDFPRIPPFRLGGKAELEYGNWNAAVLLRHSFDQKDTAPGETDTDGFTELEADLSYSYDLGNGILLTAFARANNLLDEEIRHHTSFIKDEAPRPGRNFTLGARVEF